MTILEYMLQEFLHPLKKKKKKLAYTPRKEDFASYLQVY